jgi:hypothetical protein
MKKNVGTIDALVRFVIAVLLGTLIYLQVITGTLAYVLGALAIILIITGLVGRCGIYALFGVRTCSGK